MTTKDEILASHQTCQRLTRQAGSNFPAAFNLLPWVKRQAMYALYAFMRHSDDLADDPPPGRSPCEVLRQWRGALERALSGPVFSRDGSLGEVDARGRAILP
ncbi:MAG: squalene/phytoene synthase family protein, partial [Thermoguttaceae bacterium]